MNAERAETLKLGAGGLLLALPAAALALWVYEPDKTITYAGRSYMEPATITSAVARRDLGPLQSMNARRRGMELFISESQLDKPSGDSPTVVLLRRDDGRYELYGLSGGP